MNRAFKILAPILLALACIIYPASDSAAQDFGTAIQEGIATPGCDVNIYNIHTNRAVLEASREIAMNSSFVHKPDSVLEYTCFADVMLAAAPGISAIYAAGDTFAPKLIPTSGGTVPVNFSLAPDSFDTALGLYVFQAVGAYIDTAFWHTYLGGSQPTVDIPASAPCTVMAGVWDAAKCVNFPSDRWLRFSEMLALDPRAYPHLCDAGVGFDQSTIDRSREANTTAADFVITTEFNIDYLQPNSDCELNAPVLTGVTAQITYAPDKSGQLVPYPDGFCISPGCSFRIPADLQGPVFCAR